MTPSTIQDLTAKVRQVMDKYKQEFPDVVADRDYYPFKVTEEWGECMQAHLMFTDRGRQKGKSKDEIKAMLEEECADVLGFLLLFAVSEKVDLVKALEKKWFSRLP